MTASTLAFASSKRAFFLIGQPVLGQDDGVKDGESDVVQKNEINAFSFARTLRRAQHVRARMHHIFHLPLQILRRGLDLEAAQIGHELLGADALEEAVADFVEGIRVLDGGGDFGVALEAGENGEESFRGYVGV